jgi:ankyrin repeat protein
MLADAIATDHAFNADEQQIFNLLTLHETSGMKNNANAAACLCKIALAIDDATIMLPVPLDKYAALYVVQLHQVSVRCRLTEEQELRLLQITRDDCIKKEATVRALQNQDRSLIMLATSTNPKTLKPQEQALVDDVHRMVASACSEAGIKLHSSEIAQLIGYIIADNIKYQQDKATKVQVDNRYKQLLARHPKAEATAPSLAHLGAGDDEDEGKDDRFFALPSIEFKGGQMYTIKGLRDVLNCKTDVWDEVQIYYNYQKDLDGSAITNLCRQLCCVDYQTRSLPESLDGNNQNKGFLFLYMLFTEQLNVGVHMIDDSDFDQHTFASILAGFYTFAAPPSEKSKSISSGRKPPPPLAPLVALLAKGENKAILRDRKRDHPVPVLDTAKFDDVTWRARNASEGESIDVDNPPLGRLLDELIAWLVARKEADDGFHFSEIDAAEIHAPKFEARDSRFVTFGLFKRCDTGLNIIDLSCASRELRPPNTDLLRTCLAKGCEMPSNDQLPLQYSAWPLESLLERGISKGSPFTVVENLTKDTRKAFGFYFQPAGHSWQAVLTDGTTPKGEEITNDKLVAALEQKAREQTTERRDATSSTDEPVVIRFDEKEVESFGELVPTKDGLKANHYVRAGGRYYRPRFHGRMSHPLAKDVITRMEKSMSDYSDKSGNAKVNRLMHIDEDLTRKLLSLRTTSTSTEFQDAIKKLELAGERLTELQASLREERAAELKKVDSAVSILEKLSNHVDLPKPNSPPPREKTAEEWNEELTSRYCYALRREASHEAKMDFSFMTVSLLSNDSLNVWQKINPFMPQNQQEELMQLIAMTLFHASFISHVNLLMLDAAKLSGQLTRLQKHLKEAAKEAVKVQKQAIVDIHVASKGIVNLADQIGGSLHARRYYVTDVTDTHWYDPRYLVFEFVRSLMLREAQVKIVGEYLEGLKDANLKLIEEGMTNIKPLAQQMLMGQGKTAVITPLLCLLLADGETLPMVLLPDSLLPAGREIVRSTFSTVILKRVYTLTCSRAAMAEPRYLQMMHNARKYHGVVITAPSSVKSVLLKFLENLIQLRDDGDLRTKTRREQKERQAKYGAKVLSTRARNLLIDHTRTWGQLLRLMEGSILIMDELDWVCHPMKSELNFPIGVRSPLNFAQESHGRRWELPMHLWDALFCAEDQVPPPALRHNSKSYELLRELNLVVTEGYACDALQRRPHTVLLNAAFYRKRMLPVFADWMMLYMQNEQVGVATNVSYDEIRQYLTDKDAKPLNLKPGPEWQILNLARDWLHIFLPFCMRKVLRVTFGLMTQQEVEAVVRKDPLVSKSRLKLAIPFVGKDVPSPASEFAQPDVMIGLTILAFHLQGLRKDDIDEVIKELQKKFIVESGQPQHRPSAVMYSEWVKEAGGEICGAPPPSLMRSPHALQPHTCVLYLDSRSVASSSGTYGNAVWRDLSGHWLDIDVGTDVARGKLEVHLSHKCKYSGMSPIVGRRYELVRKLRTGGLLVDVDQALHAVDSEWGSLCEAEYLKLPEGHTGEPSRPGKGDFRVAIPSIPLMTAEGGSYHCVPGAPLILPRELTANSEGVQRILRKGSIAQFGKWTDFDNRRFTLTVVAQHVADDSRKVGAQADCLSRLPISLGDSALQIGAAASIESLVFSAPSSSVKSGRWEERMPYQAAVKRSTEAVLHQFVFDGSPAKPTTIRYFVNGALLGDKLIPADVPLFSAGSPMVIGASSDGKRTWSLDGYIYLVMVHNVALSDDGVLQMSKNLMLAPDEYGAPRPGDKTRVGAQLQGEIMQLQLLRSILLVETRSVTHAALHEVLTEQELNAKPSAVAREKSEDEAAFGPAVAPSLSNETAAIEPLPDDIRMPSARVQPIMIMPESHVMHAALESEFTCTVVLSCVCSKTAPYVLASAPFFPGVLSEKIRHLNTGEMVSHGELQVHTLKVAFLAPGSYSVSYFIDGEQRFKEALDLHGGLSDSSEALFQRMVALNEVRVKAAAATKALINARCTAQVYKNIRSVPVFTLQTLRRAAKLAAASREALTTALTELGQAKAHLHEAGSVIGPISEPSFTGTVYHWLLHRHALTNLEIKGIATALLGHPHSKPWAWGAQPLMKLGEGTKLCRLSPRGYLSLRMIKATMASEAVRTVKATQKRPRVQPLFQAEAKSSSELLELLGRSPSVQKYYLRTITFPKLLMFQEQKISASGVALGSKFMFAKRIGFTGTPSDLLPMGLGKCQFAEGAEGEIVHTLTSTTLMKMVDHPDKDWTSEQLLTMIAKDDACFEQPMNALIDTGALITGMSNAEVAKFLMENGLQKRLDGVVYLGDNDKKMIYEARSKRSIQLEDSLIPLERRFCFYDQVHTTGTDIKHVPNAVAVLTIGKDMTFRDYAQGAYRMRGIATGQHINIFLVPEVKELMLRELESIDQRPKAFGKAPKDDEEKKQREGLEAVTCWLVLNQIDSECKQFNFLVQQDLTAVYRRHALKGCLDGSLAHGMEQASLKEINESLKSFIEDLSLTIPDDFKPVQGFMDNLKDMYQKNKGQICDQLSQDAVKRIFAKVEQMTFTADDSGLSQEQEQEQEEEKEQETVPRDDDQPVILSDLAFARTNEEAVPWKIPWLAEPKKCIFDARTDAAREPTPTEGDTLPAGCFYHANQFGIHHGERIAALPDDLLISRNFYNPEWKGPRRVKNVVVLLEWIPSLRALAQERGGSTRGDPPPALAQERGGGAGASGVPALDAKVDSRQISEVLWDLFACGNKLTKYGLQQILGRVLYGEHTDEKDVDSMMKELVGNQGSTHALTSKEQLQRILESVALGTELKGRHFVAITLREAEVLRATIHARSRRRSSEPSMLLDGGQDTVVGLRLVSSSGFRLLDASHKFPDYADRQLRRACEVLRFIDQQTHFSEPATLELLRVFNQTDLHTREHFRRQMLLGRRRENPLLEHTPLWTVLQSPTELALLQRTALRTFLQMGLRCESMVAKSIFGWMDINQDSLLQLNELAIGLAVLELSNTDADCLMWLSAIDSDSLEISLRKFTEFLETGASAATPASGPDAETDMEKQANWRPKVLFSTLCELRQRAELDLAATVQGRRDKLMRVVKELRDRKAKELKQRNERISTQQRKLLLIYEQEEEQNLGPNPAMKRGEIVYSFSRLNLPKNIEFHGLPDFMPEVDKQYEGKQYFALHELAYFYVRPIRVDRTSSQLADGKDTLAEPTPAESTPAESTQPTGASAEPTPLMTRGAADGSGAADERDEDEPRPQCLPRYSIYLHMKVTGKPSIPLHLVEIMPPEDDGDELATLQLETNMKVCDTMQIESSLRQWTSSSLVLKSDCWEQVTIVVDCVMGTLAVYLNGEQMYEVQDAKKICLPQLDAKGNLLVNGPFALWPHAGFKMFQESDVAGVKVALREMSISQEAMTAEQVRKQHEERGAWPCRMCHRMLGADRTKCWQCAHNKPKSATKPVDPLLKNGDVAGVRTVVASTFKEEVLKHCAKTGANFVLFYSKGRYAAKEVLAEWAQLGKLFEGMPLHVSVFDLDENDLQEEQGLSESDKQMLAVRAVPSCVLFLKGCAASSAAVGPDEDYSLVKGLLQRIVVLKLESGVVDGGARLSWSQQSADAPKDKKQEIEAFGSANTRCYLEFLTSVAARLSMGADAVMANLESHLSGCFAAYWRKMDMDGRFAGLRAALVDFSQRERALPLRDAQMWLSDTNNFASQKSALQESEQAEADKAEEEAEWTTLEEKWKTDRTPEEIAKKRKEWQAAKKKLRDEKLKQQKDADERTSFEDIADRVVFRPDREAAHVKWAEQSGINDKLRKMCTALRETFATQPGLFLSRMLLLEPCIVRGATPMKDVGSMNLTEVVHTWPTVRRIVVGHSDEKTRKKLIEEGPSSLKRLLALGLPLEAAPFGYSMLYLACAQGNSELVEFLIRHGANLHALSKDCTLPIEVAAAMGDDTIVTTLLKYGSFFGSALHYAAASGQSHIVKTLLRAKADPCIGHAAPGTSKEKTPLELALLHEHATVIDVLHLHLKDVNSTEFDRSHSHRTEFDRAIERLPLSLRGSSLLPRDKRQDAARDEPLSSSIYDYLDVRDYLLGLLEDKPTKPDAADALGWTALSYAALLNDAEAARKLLDLGAKHTVRDRHNLSCVLWAHWSKHLTGRKDFLDVLREKRGPSALVLDGTDKEAFEKLRHAAENAADPAVQQLLKVTMPSYSGRASSAGAAVGAATLKRRKGKGKAQLVQQTQLDERSHQQSVRGISDLLERRAFDPSDKPRMSLEEYLLWLADESEFQGRYPCDGVFKGDMVGFINSCKAGTLDIIASNTQPLGATPVDVFALQLYSRPELYAYINKAFRTPKKGDKKAEAESALAQRLWRPVVWYIATAHTHLRPKPGIYFRGVNKLFRDNFIDLQAYAPGNVVTFSSFSSSTSDLRVASRFMYTGNQMDKPEGVVFKIYAKTATPIDWCSYAPHEKEHLFNPEARFRVLNWYPATSANLRRGMRVEHGQSSFLLSCDSVVEAVPLPALKQSLPKLQQELREHLHGHHVMLIELEEVPLTRDQLLEIEEKMEAERFEAVEKLKRANEEAAAQLKVEATVAMDALKTKLDSDAERRENALLSRREADLTRLSDELTRAIINAEKLCADHPLLIRDTIDVAQSNLRKLQKLLQKLEVEKMSPKLQSFTPLLHEVIESSPAQIEELRAAEAARQAASAAGAAGAAVMSGVSGVAVDAPPDADGHASSTAKALYDEGDFETQLEQLQKLEEILTSNPSMMDERKMMNAIVARVRERYRLVIHSRCHKLGQPDEALEFEGVLDELKKTSKLYEESYNAAFAQIKAQDPSGAHLAEISRLAKEQNARSDEVCRSQIGRQETAQLPASVSPHELPATLSAAPSAAEETLKVKQTFDHFDANNNGYLEVQELRKALEHHGLNLSTAEAGRIMSLYNDKPDGKLDLSEFAQAVRDLDPHRCYFTVRRDVLNGNKPTFCQKTKDQVELFCQAAVVRMQVTLLLADKFRSGGIKPLHKLKRHTRLTEKAMLRTDDEGSVDRCCDVVRDMYRADSIEEVARVVREMCTWPQIQIVRIKDRYDDNNKSDGGWRDCMINYVVKDAPHMHICELQVAHEKMLTTREGLHAHGIYNHVRNAVELQERMLAVGGFIPAK